LLDGAFKSRGGVWRKLDFDRTSTEFMCHKECRLGLSNLRRSSGKWLQSEFPSELCPKSFASP
jgi:hypothetical protein